MINWKNTRLKNLLTVPLVYGLNISAEGEDRDKPRYIRITDFDDYNHLSDSTFKSLSYKQAYPALLKDKDLLFARSGATVGKTFLYRTLPYGACFAGYLIRARFNHNIVLPEFVSYYTKSIIYEQWKSRTYIQATIQNISAEKYYQMPISIPNLDTQKRIVKYLDKKIHEIDTQIDIQEKLKDAYIRLKTSVIHTAVTRGLNPNVELKDSGIEWIGMIPEHWNVKRLKDVSFMYCGLTGKAGDDFRCDHEEYTKPYIPFTNVLNNTRIDFSQFNRVIMSDEEKQNTIKENDLIFLMSSEDYKSIAKTAVVIGNPGEVYLNSFCRGLRFTSNDIYSAFINYQLSSETYRDSLRFEARGFTRINIKINCITSQFITIPSYEEQQAIAEYLDRKCSAIEEKIKNIEKQIDAYKRLRKALINEVITGQRTV